MIAKHYGRSFPPQELRQAAEIGKDGVNLLGIAQAAEGIGFRTLAVKVTTQKLLKEAPLPCILHWGQNHFVVLAPLTPKGEFRRLFGSPPLGRSDVSAGGVGGSVSIADPARGLITYSIAEFESQWATTTVDGEKQGIALLLEVTPGFHNPNPTGTPASPNLSNGGEGKITGLSSVPYSPISSASNP